MHGLVGLHNLGITCSMNASLQTLSNTKPLTEFILSGNYIQDINRDNPKGSKGHLIDEYIKLIKEIWFGTNSKISPIGLKKVLNDFSNQFKEFLQVDLKEILSLLIEGIHEDLNRVKVKLDVEDPDRSLIDEKELAERYWENYRKLNDSIIAELMHGQCRYKALCPDCGFFFVVSSLFSFFPCLFLKKIKLLIMSFI